MITVLGKLKDTQRYCDLIGYNVMPILLPDWTPELNRAWLDAAIERGDQFLIVSNDYSEEFRNELIYLLQIISSGHNPIEGEIINGSSRQA